MPARALRAVFEKDTLGGQEIADSVGLGPVLALARGIAVRHERIDPGVALPALSTRYRVRQL